MSPAALPAEKAEPVEQDACVRLFGLLFRARALRASGASAAEPLEQAKTLVRERSLFGAYTLLVSRGALPRDRELAEALAADLEATRKPLEERVADPSNSELDAAQRKEKLVLMLLQRCALVDAGTVFASIGLRTLPLDSQVRMRLATMRLSLLHGRFDVFRTHLLAAAEQLPNLGYENRTSLRVHRAVGLLLGAVAPADVEAGGPLGAEKRAFDFIAGAGADLRQAGAEAPAVAGDAPSEARTQTLPPPLTTAPAFLALAAIDLTSAVATYASEALMPYDEFVRICFAVAITCTSRKEFLALQELSTEANAIVTAEPALARCIRCLQDCEYSLFAPALAGLSQFCTESPFLYRASAAITREFRVRVFGQYLSAFRSASLGRMAAALGVPEEGLGLELQRLIQGGRLPAAMDAVAGTVFLRDQSSLDALAAEFRGQLEVLTRAVEQKAKLLV